MLTCEIYEMWRPRLKSFSHSLFRHSQRTPPQRVCVCRNSRQTAIALWQFDYFMSKWKTLRSLFCRMFFVDFFSFFLFVPLWILYQINKATSKQSPESGADHQWMFSRMTKNIFSAGKKLKMRRFAEHFSIIPSVDPFSTATPSPFSLPRATQRVRTFICESANNINTYI